MAKERTTVTLDQDVAEYVSQDHINTSGLVNKLLRTHMEGGDVDNAIRELRRQQIRSELESLEGRMQQKREELDRLSEIEASAEELTDDELDKIRQVPKDEDHPLIQRIAEDHDMTPTEAIRRAYE